MQKIQITSRGGQSRTKVFYSMYNVSGLKCVLLQINAYVEYTETLISMCHCQHRDRVSFQLSLDICFEAGLLNIVLRPFEIFRSY